jgi:hypothetical protein
LRADRRWHQHRRRGPTLTQHVHQTVTVKRGVNVKGLAEARPYPLSPNVDIQQENSARAEAFRRQVLAMEDGGRIHQ